MKAHESDFCYGTQCALSKRTPFTVGGIKGKLAGASYDSTAALDSLEFGFDSFGFQSLKSALIEKYPAAKCVESSVTTRLGIRAPVVCRYETDQGGIYLIRAAGNINKSMLLIMSAEKKSEIESRIEAATKDL